MADANNDHVVKIVADTSEANKQLDESAAKLDNIDKKTDKASRSFAKLGSSLSASLKNSGINNIGDTLSGAFTKVKDMGASLRDSLRMSGEAKKSAQQIDDMGRSMEASVKRASAFQRILATLSPTARGFYDEAEEIRAKMVDLQAEMQAMAQQQLPTAEYAKVQEELRKTQAELDKYAAKRDKLVATSKNVEDTAAWQKLQGEITKTEERLVACVHQMRDMEASGEQYDDVFKATVAQLDKAQTRLDGLLSAQDQMRSRGVDQASQEWQKLAVEIYTVQTNVQAYEAQIQNAKESGLDLSAAYKVLKDDMEAAEKQLEEYNSKQAQMKESGAVEHTAAWRNLQYDIDRATQQAESYKSVLASMEDTGAAFTSGADSDAYAEASQQLEEYKAELDDVSARGRSAFGGIASTIGSKLTGALKTAASIAGSTLVSALKKAGSGIASFVKGFANIGRQTKSTTSLIEKAARVFTSFGRMLKTRIKRTFISAVFKDIKASVGDIAKISDRFNTSVSGMVASCMQLGSQIIAAVEPIVTVAAPYISKFVDLLTAGADKLAQFIARLTGNNTYLKASKEQYDYAASLDETANSTKKAEKAAKSYQNTVLSFDQLNKMNGNDVDSEVEDITGVSDSTLNKAETQATALNEIADKIHDALTRGDYYGAGTAAAEGVNALVSSLHNMLGWSKNSDKITQKLGNFIDAVKGFTSGFDAVGAGAAVGDIANTLFESLNILTKPDSGLPFKEIGQNIGQMIISGLLEVHWGTVGTDIIQIAQGFLSSINGMLTAKVMNEETGEMESLGSALGSSFSDMFAGAVNSIRPEEWGSFLANLVNTISDFIVRACSDESKFTELGTKLGSAVNHAVSGVDSDNLAGAISSLARAFTSLISAAFAEVDWSNIWSKLGETLTSDSMDFVAIFESMALLAAPRFAKALLSSVVGTAGTVLSGIGSKAFGGLKSLGSKAFGGLKSLGSKAIGGIQSLFGGGSAAASTGGILSKLGTFASKAATPLAALTGGVIAVKKVGERATNLLNDATDIHTDAYNQTNDDLKRRRASGDISDADYVKQLSDALYASYKSETQAFKDDHYKEGSVLNWLDKSMSSLFGTKSNQEQFELNEMNHFISDLYELGYETNQSMYSIIDSMNMSSKDLSVMLEGLAEWTGVGEIDASGVTGNSLQEILDQLDLSTEQNIAFAEKMKLFSSSLPSDIAEQSEQTGDTIESIVNAMNISEADKAKLIADANAAQEQSVSDLASAVESSTETVKSTADSMTSSYTELSDGLTEASDNVLSVFDGLTSFVDKLNSLAQNLTSKLDAANDGYNMHSSHAGSADRRASLISAAAMLPFAGRFANGGIVGDGQLFIANEGGRAELIGSDRGNTAVVNNNQIISAVVSGVRSAMMEAMMTFNNNTGGGDGAGDLVLIVDSEELARASLRGQRKIDKRTNPTMSFA